MKKFFMLLITLLLCNAAAAENFYLLDSSNGGMAVQAFFSWMLHSKDKSAALPEDLNISFKKGDLPNEGALPENCAVAGEDLRKYDLKRFSGSVYGLLPVIVIVSRDFPLDNISTDDLRRIYSGRLGNWSRLGLPDMAVRIAGSDLRNAIGRAFRKLVMQQDIYGTRLPDAASLVSPVFLQCRNARAAEAVVKSVPGVIVFGSWRLAANKNKDYKVLKVNNVEPTLKNILARRYPLTAAHALWYNAANPPARLPEITLFLRKMATKSGVFIDPDAKK